MRTNIIIFLSFVILFSCGKKSSDLEFKVNELLGQDAEISFATIKSEILSPHCISCHSDVSTESGLSKWISPRSPGNSSFFTYVENGSIPKNQAPLDTRLLELIRLYIANMPTSTGGTTGTATSGISYAQIKSAVLVPYGCVNCHSVGTEAKLANWINTSNPTSSSFYTTIKNGSMPRGGSRVSVANQAMVLQYVFNFANRQ